MKSFPKPLTQSEEGKYIALYYEHGDLNARDRLIEHNMRLVCHVIKKYSLQDQDFEELLSIGFVGLMKGVNTFDPKKAKNTKFATYVGRCIENAILTQMRIG